MPADSLPDDIIVQLRQRNDPKADKVADDLQAMRLVWDALLDDKIDWHNAASMILTDAMMDSATEASVEAIQTQGLEGISRIQWNAMHQMFMMGYVLGTGEYRIEECRCKDEGRV
jgi:hypothetical protein